MVIDRKVEAFIAPGIEPRNPKSKKTETGPTGYEHKEQVLPDINSRGGVRVPSFEEMKQQNKFVRNNDLEKFCNDTWKELNGDNSELSSNNFDKIKNFLWDRYKGQITNKEYVQADARGIIRQLS